MEWLYLGIAGAMEVLWSTFLKFSEGFTKPLPTVITAAGLAASMFFLAKAAKVLPIGTAYGIWTGIGALGAVIVGIVVFKEPATAGRMFFASLLLVGIVGLVRQIFECFSRSHSYNLLKAMICCRRYRRRIERGGRNFQALSVRP